MIAAGEARRRRARWPGPPAIAVARALALGAGEADDPVRAVRPPATGRARPRAVDAGRGERRRGLVVRADAGALDHHVAGRAAAPGRPGRARAPPARRGSTPPPSPRRRTASPRRPPAGAGSPSPPRRHPRRPPAGVPGRTSRSPGVVRRQEVRTQPVEQHLRRGPRLARRLERSVPRSARALQQRGVGAVGSRGREQHRRPALALVTDALERLVEPRRVAQQRLEDRLERRVAQRLRAAEDRLERGARRDTGARIRSMKAALVAAPAPVASRAPESTKNALLQLRKAWWYVGQLDEPRGHLAAR